MDPITLVSFIGSFYFFIWFSDTIFTTCMHYPYITFLKETGLGVGFLKVSWQTGIFNRRLYRWGKSFPRFLNAWFTIGVIVGLGLIPVAILILINTGIQSFSGSPSKLPVLQPILPGVNIPVGDFTFYIIALFLSSVVHEVGHAIASINEDVQFLAIGFNVIFLLPMAYVNLNANHLAALSAYRRLKIFTAGIWHNAILSVFAFILLTILPHCLSLGYKVREGVQVIEVHPKSPLSASEGFAVGDIITNINYHSVKSRDDWERTFQDMLNEQFGFCVTADFVHLYDESVGAKHLSNGLIDCCEEGNGNICFEYIDSEVSVVRLPQHMCLPARKITNYGFHKCYPKTNYACRLDYNCIKPLIHNTTSFIVIERLEKNDVLYLGYPSDIYRSVYVSDYIPKSSFLPPVLPDYLEKLFKYIIIFSCGLAIINAVPCYAFDGQYISKCGVELIFRKKIQSTVYFGYVLMGTIITVVSLLFMLQRVFI